MTVSVVFDSGRVLIRNSSNDVQGSLLAAYSHMISAEAEKTVGVIEVCEQQGGYVLSALHTSYPPVERLDILLHLVKTEVLSLFMNDRPDLLWLHAAAVAREGLALVIPARSGQGKSTLSTKLCAAGWLFMSDDAAPVRLSTGEVLAYPQTPLRRIYPGILVPETELGELERESVAIGVLHVRGQPAVIKAIVFPTYDHEAPVELRELRGGDAALELLRNASNLSDGVAKAVSAAAAMAQRLPCFGLKYSDSDAAVELLNRL